MALQTDGYNADTEGSNNSPPHDSDEEMEDDKDPELAKIVLDRLDMNGGPPFFARDYLSDDNLSDYSIESIEDADSDYDEKPKKRKRRAPKRVKCDECNRHFVTKRAALKHKAVHSGEFACQKCDKKCASAGTLRVHQRVHTGERPHACAECGKAFAFKMQLQAHIDREHSDGLLSFACDQCDRAFHQEHHLNFHQRVHRRQHECHFCGKGCLSAARLRAHVQGVHRAQPAAAPDDGGRRSGRTARVDYRDDVINVEQATAEPKRKRPSKAFSVKKVQNRLRQRDGAPAAKKTKKRRPVYTGTGTQPSRQSSRSVKSVSYADKSSDEDDDEAPPKRGRVRSSRGAVIQNGEEESAEENESKSGTQRRGRGRGREEPKLEDGDQTEEIVKTQRERGRPRKDPETVEEEEQEPERTPRGRSHHRKTPDVEAEEEPDRTSLGRGRPKKRQPPQKKASKSESESDEDEEQKGPENTPRGRGRSSIRGKTLAERILDEDNEEVPKPTKKTPGRGRPRKADTDSDEEEENNGEETLPAKKSPPRGRGRPRKAATDSGEEDSGDEILPAKKSPPRGRGRPKATTPVQNDSHNSDLDAAGSGASDAESAPPPATPARRGRASAAAERPAARGGGRRSTAASVSFAERSDSEESRDEAESRVPPKKRRRGRQ